MAIIPSNIFVGPYDPFCHDVWDPFQEFGYGGPLITVPHTYPNEASSFMNSMRFDWQETPDGKFLLKAEIPGFKKEQVKVDLEEGRVLLIKGEKSVEKNEKSHHWQRVERSSGKFLRRLMLPENAVPNKMKVYMENGMLNVTFPKENVRKHSPKTRVIQISGH